MAHPTQDRRIAGDPAADGERSARADRTAAAESAGPLFDPRHAARTLDPPTSKAAAGMAVGLAADHQRRILEWLAGAPREGSTKDQIAKGMGLDDVAVARRMRSLADAGLVEEHGTGLSSRNRAAIRWRAVTS